MAAGFFDLFRRKSTVPTGIVALRDLNAPKRPFALTAPTRSFAKTGPKRSFALTAEDRT